MTYLLDCFPPKQILIENNKIYEIQINTWLKKNNYLLDTTIIPPKLYQDHELKKIINTKLPTNPVLLKKLSAQIHETTIKIPLEKSSLNNTEKEMLLEYINFINHPKNTRFNFSSQIFDFFKSIHKKSSANKLFCCFDFGDQKAEIKFKNNQYISSYGAATFYRVNFKLLEFYAKKLNLNFAITNYKSKISHIAILYQTKIPQIFTKKFQKITNQDISTIISDHSKKIKNISKKLEGSKQRLKDVESNLKKFKLSYIQLIELSLQCFYIKEYEKAAKYANKAIKNYRTIAIYAYECLGKIEQAKKNYNNAEKYFKIVNSQCPHQEQTLFSLSMVYVNQSNIPDCLRTINQCLAATDHPFFLSIYIHLITILKQVNQSTSAEAIKNKLLQIHQINSSIFPKKVIRTLQ